MIEQHSRNSSDTSSASEYIYDSADDDFMFKSKKPQPTGASCHKKEEHKDDDSGSSLSEHEDCDFQQDPEGEVLQKMEEYYDKNFTKYEVYTGKNFFQERVWNVFYDEIHDLVYIYIANIE